MKTTRIAKTLAAGTLAVVMALSMAGCSAGGSKEVDTTYTITNASLIDDIGWYHDETYTLSLNTDNTYELNFTTVRFGAEDYDMRGLRVITYSGEYESVASADGEVSHLDVTLQAPTQITWNQQGKGFTRVQSMPGNFYLNTSEWTDTMAGFYADGDAESFLAEYGKEMTLTVEDPSLSPEDTTLNYRIIGVPDLGITNE